MCVFETIYQMCLRVCVLSCRRWRKRKSQLRGWGKKKERRRDKGKCGVTTQERKRQITCGETKQGIK